MLRSIVIQDIVQLAAQLTVEQPSISLADQPMGDAETLEGARNRAARCRELRPDAAFTVGCEGGCEVVGDEMTCLAWMSVQSAKGVEGKASAARFFLPKSMSSLVASGTHTVLFAPPPLPSPNCDMAMYGATSRAHPAHVRMRGPPCRYRAWICN
jgi:hypothetical protein